MVSKVDVNEVIARAEKYYRDGDFFCSEAVVKTIKDAYGLDFSDDVIKMASGFPIGIGRSGCLCGAVSGGVMALGMVSGRKEGKDPRVQDTLKYSAELHDRFKESRKSTCCRVLTRKFDMGCGEHKEQCISITGEVAGIVADIINRENLA